MKKLFLSLFALAVAAMSYAQSSMLATLSHDGNIKTYYGVSALKNAYNAARNGDVITLSSGSFEAVDIAKGLTIRGAGMGIDTLSNSEPTMIVGDFNIKIPSTSTARLTLEGIYHNHTITVSTAFKNGTFLKSRFKDIKYEGASVTNLTMIHCKVAGEIRIGSNSSVSCVNCIVCYFSQESNTSIYEFANCVLMSPYWFRDVTNCSFKNCIFYISRDQDPEFQELGSGCTAFNCLSCGTTGRNYIFNSISNSTNKAIDNMASLFKTFRGTYSDNETFELTETAKKKYKGIDGTQVGIYGSNMPFDPIPSNPQITKCNVAAKSTADGKLSVDIEVNGAE